MSTHQEKKEAFAHVMGTVLNFEADSPMIIVTGDLKYGSIKDIVTNDKKEVMRFWYIVKVTKGDQSIE
eukprot:11689206-Ditylum_brightwellii.AAC.1